MCLYFAAYGYLDPKSKFNGKCGVNEVLRRFMYCEKFIVKCVTFIMGIIISLYKWKLCLSDTNLI